MASFQLLEPREEEELYKTRLLNVEEKPFKRITKRLATLHRVVAASVRQEQTPPPEGGEDNEAKQEDPVSSIALLREDVTLDFAAFDASVARLQFLGSANARERARYAEDRGTILATCQQVRDNMVALRAQLEQARATLAQRKVFDELADRITHSKTLKPRPDQEATIRKLEDECRQLQEESAAYAETWRERREQFARIMDESMRLRRLIRDEKEEVERREGMDEEEGAGGGGGGGAAASAAAGGGATTPAHGGGGGGGGAAAGAAHHPGAAAAAVNAHAAGAADASAGGRTPLHHHESPAPADYEGGLRPQQPDAPGSSSFFSRAASRGGSRAVSREATPNPSSQQADDVDMVEVGDGASGQPEATPSAAAATPAAATRQAADDAGAEQMDTT